MSDRWDDEDPRFWEERAERKMKQARKKEKGGQKKMQGRGGIATFALGLIAVSLALIIGPQFLAEGAMIKLVCAVFGIIGLVIGGVMVTIAKLYVKTSANQAFYRTGQGAPKVIIDGGAIVIPVVHELLMVSLETMKLEVKRLGPDALICKDFLRVDVAGEFYIRVKKDEEGVKAAATTLGDDATNPTAIKDRMMEKLVSALRTVAATMDLNELHQNREEFAKSVLTAVEKDITPNGLELETVTISQLDMTDVGNLKENNVFDAQGLRKATEITQTAKVRTNEIERDADLQITTKNVETRKAVLAQEQDQSFAEADQSAEVKNRQAAKNREVAEFEIAQQEEVEKRAVGKTKAVETAEVEKDRAVRAAEIQRETALVEEAQKRETAEVEKTKAVEVAERKKQVALAAAEEERADAQAKQRLAEAKERESAEKVTTAATLEIARRDKEKAVIAAEQDGETRLIEQQKTADADAYTETKKAEAEKQAAENRAAAQIRLAEAGLESKRREAEGEKAVQIVPVEVDREQVSVEAARVEVLKNELEAKTAAQEVSIGLEIAKLQISAGQAVGQEMAKSIGQFMAAADFNIFGDPETLANMVEKFGSGLGVSQMLAGLKDGSPLIGDLLEAGIQAGTAGAKALKTKAEEAVTEGSKDKKPVKAKKGSEGEDAPAEA